MSTTEKSAQALINSLKIGSVSQRLETLTGLADVFRDNSTSTAAGLRENYKVDMWKRIALGYIGELEPAVLMSAIHQLFYQLILGTNKGQVLAIAAYVGLQLSDPKDHTKLALTYDGATTNTSKLLVDGVQSRIELKADALPVNWKGTPVIANNPSAKKFVDSLNTMKGDDYLIWGPIAVLIILRLEKRNAESTARKLSVSMTLAKNVYSQNFTSPEFSDAAYWLSLFQNYTSVNVPEESKNLLYLGMIETYHKGTATTEFKGLLDFCTLQSLRYTGMILITLIDQVCQLYN